MRKRAWLIAVGIMLTLMVLSVMIGRYRISFREMDEISKTLLFHIRMPRTFLVFLSGMALALAGSTYQKVFQNPLVSPDVLGATSGASLGACVGMVLFSGRQVEIAVFAFIGAITMVSMTLYLAKFIQRKTLGFILSGMITSAIAGALVMFLKIMADPYRDLPSIEFWLMGAFSHASWQDVIILLPVVSIIGGLMLALVYPLDVLSLGEEHAKSLGMHVKTALYLAVVGGTLLVATVVSLSGLISWIGLIAPHIGKRFCKGAQLSGREVLAIIMLTGGSLLLAADLVARTVLTIELPISILTSFFGGMVLMIVLIRRKET